jgi:hypothetical protein
VGVFVPLVLLLPLLAALLLLLRFMLLLSLRLLLLLLLHKKRHYLVFKHCFCLSTAASQDEKSVAPPDEAALLAAAKQGATSRQHGRGADRLCLSHQTRYKQTCESTEQTGRKQLDCLLLQLCAAACSGLAGAAVACSLLHCHA